MSDKKEQRNASEPVIKIRGAKQNNLKNLNLDIRLGEFTVVAGLSGSGKSSLVFDTLYAEGQRRYVETFSPYARQFLDRMTPPQVDSIEGIPPAIAIDQSGSIRTSRSTVGTMSEINDHLKQLFANHASLYCPSCGQRITENTPESIWNDVQLRLAKAHQEKARVYIAFDLLLPAALPLQNALDGLSAQGFTRIIKETALAEGTQLTVVADRFKADSVEAHRAIQAIHLGLEKGHNQVDVYIEKDGEFEKIGTYRQGFICGDCNLSFQHMGPGSFSFNSPIGACDTCKGFGKTLNPNPDLIIPDPTLSIADGCIRPWASKGHEELLKKLCSIMAERNMPIDVPYQNLPQEVKSWLWDGDPQTRQERAWEDFDDPKNRDWFGINYYFKRLEEKTYKLHIRVLLNRYRSDYTCPECGGARLKAPALLWRYGAESVTRPVNKNGELEGFFKPSYCELDDQAYLALPGYNYHELATLPISALKAFFESQATDNEAESLLLKEIINRLSYLCEVGLGYLTLDRQGRTLSGGEVQRVNLASALGTSLVNTLFVLDEPSIGLHPRDMDRVNRVMRRLTDAGNTLVVVEHDPQVMLAGQRLLELGPGAGVHGGEIVFNGTTREALKADTLTGSYLSGRLKIERKRKRINPQQAIVIEGARHNNLKNVTARFPLGGLIAVAGVSGSGKSSLIGDILVPLFTKTQKLAGAFDRVRWPGKTKPNLVYMDQASVGQTSRGTPVSYLGIFDLIRALFANANPAFNSRDFSFNSGEGRCPTCKGSGYEEISMQFLSDIRLPCPTCHGTRYRPEVLKASISLKGGKQYNIAEVLDLTVDEAIKAFEDNAHISWQLKTLRHVALGHIKLGQSLNTLSNGELQRLKVAYYVNEALRNLSMEKTIFVFDEPTTGLHFNDVSALLNVFSFLVEKGHTVIAIEHNLDILNNADWILELGPDAGDNGGEIVFEGTPDEIVTEEASPTGKALLAWRHVLTHQGQEDDFFNLPPLKTAPYRADQAAIEVHKANEHNLKNLSVNIPREKFSVITGPSGSGKSTLAFDLIFAEGQRRYLESLNAYARSMVQTPPIPDVESIRGIPPTVAISQRTSRGGMRSTVATMSEIWHFLRLIYEKLGTQYCPDCHVPVSNQSVQSIKDDLLTRYKWQDVNFFAPTARRKKGGFATELAQYKSAGYLYAQIDGVIYDLKEPLPTLDIHTEHDINVYIGHVTIDENNPQLDKLLERALEVGNKHLLVTAEALKLVHQDKTAIHWHLYALDNVCPQCDKSFPPLSTKSFSYNSTAGACLTCSGYGVITKALEKAQKLNEDFDTELSKEALTGKQDDWETCPECQGARLNAQSRSVLWKDKAICDIGRMTIRECQAFFEEVSLTQRETLIIKDVITEIQTRLKFLMTVGLDYMQLERGAPTLSGGEAQRIRLAAQLGSNLKGACYILDEPTIGLHPRDNAMLLNAIEMLTHKGNTLLVVEHDEETIRRAEHIIDIGPGAGIRGGELVAQGSLEDIEKAERSSTGYYLKHPLSHTGIPEHTFDANNDSHLTVKGLRYHNVNVKSLDIPLNALTVITGVSGSGKSTLTNDILFENLAHVSTLKRGETPQWRHCEGIDGTERFKRVLQVDQSPIGKTSRSCPATYIGFMNAIRDLFAQSTEAQIRGYTPQHFSFNLEGGCPECHGVGYKTIEMSFMPDVKVECETCHGARYKEEVLDVTWNQKNIAEILQMEVDDAVTFFENIPAIAHPVKLLQDVGLGYLTLGQISSTLSGGEAQRIKLITELAKVREIDDPKKPKKTNLEKTQTIYILDEPTVGLHMGDVNRLIKVLKRLVKAGNTVIVVEHNLDLIAEADWVIDMGPEGGQAGGRVVGEGTPKALARKATPTGKALKQFLKEHA